MSDLAKKAYPCKRNQEHKQEQEEHNQSCVDYELESHKLMSDDTVRWQIWSNQNETLMAAAAAAIKDSRGVQIPWMWTNGLQRDTRANILTDGVVAPK
jgi:hypothetical protein